MPRGLTPDGVRGIEAVLRAHLDRGWHYGAQAAVFRDGQLAFELRLGTAEASSARMIWFSATKPLTAVCVLMLAERGLLDLDAPIARLWPEFAQGGKETCTTRHVLTHQGGFPVFSPDFDWARLEDWDAVTAATAALPALWPPGTAIGYHPVTYGFALGEVIRRVDGRMPREFMRDELFAPLHLDASLGVPQAQFADVVPVHAMSEVTFDDPEGSERRTSNMVARFNAPEAWRAQIPAANGIGTAEALARFYAMLERGGELDGVRALRADTVREATRIQVHTDSDWLTGYPSSSGLGFTVGGGYAPLDELGTFGHFGQQSTVGYADPLRGLAAAYLTDGLHDPVVVALRHAEFAAAVIAACD